VTTSWRRDRNETVLRRPERGLRYIHRNQTRPLISSTAISLPVELQETDGHSPACHRRWAAHWGISGPTSPELQTEREDPNVIVIIREVQKTEQIIALANAEGEFVRTPPQRHGQETGSKELQEACAQLQEAEEIIQSARTKDEEQARQIAELQDALLEQ
jgi:hypothetical protein